MADERATSAAVAPSSEDTAAPFLAPDPDPQSPVALHTGPSAPARVRARLAQYCAERRATMLIASHNMAEVERLCERVIIMKRGRIEDDDSPDQIMARYNRTTLEDVFLDVARGRVREGTP